MMSIIKKINILVLIFCFFSFFNIINYKKANAIKIVAVVNEAIITDIDVDEFSNILCLLQNIKKCDKQQIMPMSLMTLVDANIKSEHMKRLGINNDEFKKGYEEYKQHITKAIKLTNNVNKEQFDWFIFTEYKWNAIVSSMMKDVKIDDNEVKKFKEKNKNINLTDEQIKNAIYNKKMEDKSRNLVSEAKKYYLIDIKI